MESLISCQEAYGQTRKVVLEKHEEALQNCHLRIKEAIARGDFSLHVKANKLPPGVRTLLVEAGYRITLVESLRKEDELFKISWDTPSLGEI